MKKVLIFVLLVLAMIINIEFGMLLAISVLLFYMLEHKKRVISVIIYIILISVYLMFIIKYILNGIAGLENLLYFLMDIFYVIVWLLFVIYAIVKIREEKNNE